MFSIIAVVLGVAAIVVYYKGVRSETAWGTQVMTVLVIGAVIAAILPLTPLQDVIEGRGVGLRYQQFEHMGRELRGELSRDDSVLVVMERMDEMMMGEDIDLDEAMEEQARQITDAIASGARTRLSVAGSVNLSGSSAGDWNDALAEYQDQGVDLIVSQTLEGLPLRDRRDLIYELEELDCFEWAPVPLVAADMGNSYNPDMLREYMQDGLLSAVSLRPARGEPSVGIGPDNVQDIPSAAPVGPYSR